ncbi:hypothetical protein Bbelb_016700 [Branchiostoma belcheri]|nr:hypothetical protein Bbelb_016700 [Branchiostoma belcheri]
MRLEPWTLGLTAAARCNASLQQQHPALFSTLQVLGRPSTSAERTLEPTKLGFTQALRLAGTPAEVSYWYFGAVVRDIEKNPLQDRKIAFYMEDRALLTAGGFRCKVSHLAAIYPADFCLALPPTEAARTG